MRGKRLPKRFGSGRQVGEVDLSLDCGGGNRDQVDICLDRRKRLGADGREPSLPEQRHAFRHDVAEHDGVTALPKTQAGRGSNHAGADDDDTV